MSDLKLTPSLLSMLERIERHSGTLLMLAIAASGGQDGKLNKLRGAGYVVKCDHPSVTEGAWPAQGGMQEVKLPRFRGVLASLVDYASVGWTSIACS